MESDPLILEFFEIKPVIGVSEKNLLAIIAANDDVLWMAGNYEVEVVPWRKHPAL